MLQRLVACPTRTAPLGALFILGFHHELCAESRLVPACALAAPCWRQAPPWLTACGERSVPCLHAGRAAASQKQPHPRTLQGGRTRASRCAPAKRRPVEAAALSARPLPARRPRPAAQTRPLHRFSRCAEPGACCSSSAFTCGGGCRPSLCARSHLRPHPALSAASREAAPHTAWAAARTRAGAGTRSRPPKTLWRQARHVCSSRCRASQLEAAALPLLGAAAQSGAYAFC